MSSQLSLLLLANTFDSTAELGLHNAAKTAWDGEDACLEGLKRFSLLRRVFQNSCINSLPRKTHSCHLEGTAAFLDFCCYLLADYESPAQEDKHEPRWKTSINTIHYLIKMGFGLHYSTIFNLFTNISFVHRILNQSAEENKCILDLVWCKFSQDFRLKNSWNPDIGCAVIYIQIHKIQKCIN